jgi:hypothetical protein
VIQGVVTGVGFLGAGAALVLVILELDRIPVLRKIRAQAEAAGPTERSQEADPPPD